MSVPSGYENYRLGTGGYKFHYGHRAAGRKPNRPIYGKTLNLPILIIISALTTIAVTVPLLKIKARNLATTEIVSWDHGRRYPVYRLSSSSYEKMSIHEKRKMAAHVHYISEVIRTTKNKKIDRHKLALQIVKESLKANYDPLFVASVILEESTFRKYAVSSVGALGLMQILPSTGRYISKVEQIPWKGANKLFDPEYNVKLGIAYIKYLNRIFDNDIHKTLIAYNWGPTNLQTALEKGSKRIPLSTKTYSRQIQKHHALWREDFERKLPGYQHMQVTMHMKGFQG